MKKSHVFLFIFAFSLMFVLSISYNRKIASRVVAVSSTVGNRELPIYCVDTEEKKVVLNLTIDTNICPVIDYFEIFMERTKMSKRAAKYLGLWFELVINDTNLL